ncbi:zinc finger protein with KRAB and SCAN domains 1-like [Micropterus salmoides]|uniref:zinc finger protein with KRAB and SCAN domains 1-like n=1 Tax=Micropterus salmoides TaxID=27706 RepID=UPI0018EABEEF|nr:zinc finger protein with KRAB and SCAN domains 1-like [Micropterus salmoides]
MPQYGPPAPPDLLQTASPPSMPLCGVSPSAGSCEAPPPGLIAPLSEEDEEEEEGSFKHEKNERLRGNRRPTITTDGQKKKRRTKHIAGRVQPRRKSPGSTARRQREMDDKSQPDRRQAVVQSEGIPSKGNRKTQRGETRIQRTQKMIVKKKKEEGGKKGRCKQEQREDESTVEERVRPVKRDVAVRPRRKAVGPPIRYLIEFEERSRGPLATNHSKAMGAKAERKLRLEHQEDEETRDGVERTEPTDSSRVESPQDGGGGGWQLCQVCGLTFTCRSALQLHLSVHRAGRHLSCQPCNKKFSCASTLHLHHRRHHHEGWAASGCTRAADDKQEDEVLPRPSKAHDWSRCRKRARRNPWWWVDYQTTIRRRQQERDGARGRKRCREEVEVVKRVCLKEEGGGEEGQVKENKVEVTQVCLKEEEEEGWTKGGGGATSEAEEDDGRPTNQISPGVRGTVTWSRNSQSGQRVGI